jgi:putative transposase
MKYKVAFIPEGYYHIFSHAVGFENIFLEDENYHFFLRQFVKYICPVADTYAWCLMPNHFHFLIKVKAKNELNIPEDYSYDSHKFVMQHWSNFLNSYAKAVNKRFNRRGALFVDQIRRAYIDSEEYLFKTINYIHENPVKHQFRKNGQDWLFSSLHNYLDSKDNGFLAPNAKKLYAKSPFPTTEAVFCNEIDIENCLEKQLPF